MRFDSFLGYFKSDFKFEVQEECLKQGVNIEEECRISFDHSNKTVTKYGTVRPSAFPANPDIAGLGVCFPYPSDINLTFLSLQCSSTYD